VAGTHVEAQSLFVPLYASSNTNRRDSLHTYLLGSITD